jgi:hypothetical protein
MRQNAKPSGRYRCYFDGLVLALYNDCAPWPTSRNKKRDAMIEELSALQHETYLARDVCRCKYEVWQNGHIEPCGTITWTHEDLCSLHKPFVDSLPLEYQYKSKAGKVNDARKCRNAFYGLSSHYNATIVATSQYPQPKAI